MRVFGTLSTVLLLASGAAAAGEPDGNHAGGQHTGFYRGNRVTYTVEHGDKIFEGDIKLDHVTDSPPTRGRVLAPGYGVAYGQYLWPKNPQGVSQIPYQIENGATNLVAALNSFNATFSGLIQFVAYQQGNTDYVVFDFSSDTNGQCESSVGHIGGAQTVGGSSVCSVGTLLHELGHVVGLYHEMTRPDRNTYITVNFGNVIKGSESNFDPFTDNNQKLGLFDYASVMMYIPFAFSRNGGPVLETIPPGMPLSNQVGYTAGDIDAIERLYGQAPTAVTVTSNPPGLTVMVDGNNVVTPQVYKWPLGAYHTLAVASGAQTLTINNQPYTYIFGHWNDNGAASHQIHNVRGNGTLAQPETSPAATVYSANFVQLSPYTATIEPLATAGSVTANPAPQSYAGAPGVYLVARQKVTLTPAPTGSYKFVTLGGVSAPYSENPKVDYVPDGAVPYAVTAYFGLDAITTITTTPGGFWFNVDGTYYKAPQKFSADVFSGWGPKSTHLVTGYTPSQPYSINTRFVFDSWSDGGALSHNITIPNGASTLTGKFTAQYVPIAYAVPGCAANVTLTPTSPDGFYSAGTQVQVAANATEGLSFAGWTGDLTGTNPTQTLTVNDEKLALANYNISTTRFSLGSLSPNLFARGSAGGTVKIKGAGFTSGSVVFVNNAYRVSTYVSGSEVDVALTAADLADAGAFPIGVSNYLSGGYCGNYGALPFFVTVP
jgi:astacin